MAEHGSTASLLPPLSSNCFEEMSFVRTLTGPPLSLVAISLPFRQNSHPRPLSTPFTSRRIVNRSTTASSSRRSETFDNDFTSTTPGRPSKVLNLFEFLNRNAAEALIGYKVFDSVCAPRTPSLSSSPSSSSSSFPHPSLSQPLQQQTKRLKLIGTVRSITTFNTEGFAEENPTFLRVIGDPDPSDLLQIGNAHPRNDQSALNFLHSDDAGARLVHLLPLVADIVTNILPSTREIHVQAPEGLFDIGRRRFLLEQLNEALEPYKGTPNSLAAVQLGERTMPRQSDLLAAGRKDLVRAVKEAGGFTSVALELGLRSRRRPTGYWENENTLSEEIAMFVAANWVELKAAEGADEPDRTYWYNLITRKTRFTEPIPPKKIPLDDDGSFLFVEDDEDRVMPSAQAVRSAGRYDLHQAILKNGGYRAVSEMLDRKPTTPRRSDLASPRSLKAEIKALQRELDIDKSKMPTYQDVLELGRTDVLREIRKLGGFAASAKRMGLRVAKERFRWGDAEEAARELWTYINETQRPGQDPLPCPIDGPIRRKETINAGDSTFLERMESNDWDSTIIFGLRLPSQKSLIQSGRQDLRYALTKFGHQDISKLLKLRPNKSPRRQDI